MHYRHLLIPGIFAGLALASHPAAAQRRAAGDLDPSGRVLAKIVAGMTEPGALSHPISGIRVLVVSGSGDSVTIRTDDAGIATAWVPPGTYRFVSLDTIVWLGRSYSWDIGQRIEPGTPEIVFSQATATAATAVSPPPPVVAPAGQPPTPQTGPQTRPSPSRLRVFADCQTQGCDFDYFRTEIPFVDYVRDRQEAALHILITSEPTGGGGTAYTLNFIGVGELAGTADTLRYTAATSSTADEKRRGLARTIKLGLMRHVARTPIAEQLQISYRAPTVGRAAAPSADRDPWNLWVFSIYLNGDVSGEQSQRFTEIRGSVSANRISESWKSRLSAYASYDESSYTLSDNTKSKSLTRSYGGSQLLVRSLGPHWSIGERGKLYSSTYVNQKLFLRFAPTIEFNVFPYSESTRRVLSVQYGIGMNSFQYEDTTIFNKLNETRPHHALMVALGLKQPWGSASTSLEGGHYLDNSRQYSAVSFSELDLRLFKGFRVNLYTGVSLVRDQLYIAKGKLTDEQILLRRRKLASKYSYFGGIGLSFSFGSIFNNIVNPRFEGIGGNALFF